MAEIINFPTAKTNVAAAPTSNVTMTMTRNYRGLTVSINLAKLSKEELLDALMPLPSQNREEIKCEKLALVKKYINQ